MSTEDVTVREEAGARCTKRIKRKVLKKMARKARTAHLVNCPGTGEKRQKENR